MNERENDFGAELPAEPVEPAPEAAAPAPENAPSSDEDWQSLADEWNQETAPAEPDQPQGDPNAPATDIRSLDEILNGLRDSYIAEADRAQLARDHAGVLGQAEAIHAHLAHADLRDVLAEVQEALPDVPEGVIAKLLAGAEASDPSVRAAWENRHRNERAFRNKLESLVYEFKAALEPKYDPDLSADRFAVAAYMRGEREPAPKPALPRNLNTMSDADFKKTLDRLEPGMAERTRI